MHTQVSQLSEPELGSPLRTWSGTKGKSRPPIPESKDLLRQSGLSSKKEYIMSSTMAPISPRVLGSFCQLVKLGWVGPACCLPQVKLLTTLTGKMPSLFSSVVTSPRGRSPLSSCLSPSFHLPCLLFLLLLPPFLWCLSLCLL